MLGAVVRAPLRKLFSVLSSNSWYHELKLVMLVFNKNEPIWKLFSMQNPGAWWLTGFREWWEKEWELMPRVLACVLGLWWCHEGHRTNRFGKQLKKISKWIYSVESLNCRFWSPRKRIYLELEIWESKHKHGVYTEADRMNWWRGLELRTERVLGQSLDEY